MPIITLTSDMGTTGYYVAAMKASILSLLPSVAIVDITHSLQPFHILDASFVLRNAYPTFPPGTVHLVAIDASGNKPKRFVAVNSEGHYFVGADNGLFSLALAGKAVRAVEISMPAGSPFESFPAAGALARAACSIAAGAPLESIGKECAEIQSLQTLQPVYNAHSITTQIIYTDEYGNCFCNLDKALFQKAAGNRRFFIDIKGYGIETISNNYDDAEAGGLIALFSASGFLEIAQSYGNLSKILGLKKDDRIMITFSD